MEKEYGILIGFLEAHSAPPTVMRALHEITLEKKALVDLQSSAYSFFAQNIEDNKCKARILRVIQNEGIATIEDVYKGGASRFLKIPDFGRKALTYMDKALRDNDLPIIADGAPL
jgi:DNA-directed RNA polymerase alpha subunit